MYATLADLTLRVSHSTLAENASNENFKVGGEELKAGLAGEDLEADVQAGVDAAIARLTQSLTDATAEINGYLNSRYPRLDNPPANLTTLCVDIAIYRMTHDVPENSMIHLEYKNAIRYLEKVAAGTIDLLPPDGSAPESVGVVASKAVFTEDALRGYDAPASSIRHLAYD